MAFNVLNQYGEVATVKEAEVVGVQMVEITYRQGQVVERRVEMRKFVRKGNEGGYDGPTKEAFVFTSVDDIDELVGMLVAARNDLEAVSEVIKVVPAKPKPAAARRARGAVKAAAGRKAG